jgi:hypothetical protein
MYRSITPIINSNTIYMRISYANVQHAEIYMFRCQLYTPYFVNDVSQPNLLLIKTRAPTNHSRKQKKKSANAKVIVWCCYATIDQNKFVHQIKPITYDKKGLNTKLMKSMFSINDQVQITTEPIMTTPKILNQLLQVMTI